jgi:hypothetical protein
VNARRGGAIALTCLLLAVQLPGVAAAQTTTTTPAIDVQLVSQDAFVLAGQDMRIELKVSGAVDTAVDVKAQVYARVGYNSRTQQVDPVARAQLRDIVDAGDVRAIRQPIINLYTPSFKSVYDPARQVVTLSIPAGTGNVSAGVYPVSIEVRTARQGSTRPLITSLVRIADIDSQAPPLNLAMVLPVQTATGLQPDLQTSIAPAERARLDGLATMFGDDYPGFPLTLAPNPETFDALERGTAEDGGTLAHLKDMSEQREVIGTTFAPLDEEAWRANGLSYLLGQQLDAGLNTLKRTAVASSAQLATDVAITDPADTPATLDLRRALGSGRVVVDEDRLEPLAEQAFPSTILRTFTLDDASGSELRAAAADSRLSRMAAELSAATNPGARALISQRIVADLAAAYFDDPKLLRGTIVVLPADWAVNPTIHDVLIPTLSALPILRPVTLEQFFATVPRSSQSAGSAPAASTPLRRELRPAVPTDLAEYAQQVGRASKRVDGFEQLLEDKTRAHAITADLHDLSLASADTRLNPARRREYLDRVEDTVDRRLHAPDGGPPIVAPKPTRVTMTSRRAEIPLDLENRLDFNVQVRIELRSDKLEFPDGYLQDPVTLTPGANHLLIDVRTKTSGDSLLEIDISPTMKAPDTGITTFARARYTIRSTALSGVGFALCIGALLVLMVWWFRHARRTRQTKRRAIADAAVAAVAEAPGTPGDPTPAGTNGNAAPTIVLDDALRTVTVPEGSTIPPSPGGTES